MTHQAAFLFGLPTILMPMAALIFDLDGTLVDSEAPGLDVLHQMAADLGAPSAGLTVCPGSACAFHG